MKYLITILCISFSITAKTQDPVHRVLNNITGLPSNTVYNILQDKKGFIWIAHDKGLSRYDGKQFLNYKNSSAQSKSLSNLLEINDAIYCQDFSGNYFKTTSNNELEKIKFSTPGPFSMVGLVNNNLVSIKFDSLKTFNLNTQKTTSSGLDSNKNNGVFFENNVAYFLSNNKVVEYNGVTYSTVFNLKPTNFAFNYIIKSQRKFYAITKNIYPYVYLLDNNKLNALPYLPKGVLIQDVSVINNEIWVCTSTGAFCFNEKFEPKYNGQVFFRNNSVSKVLIDKEGNYWFSTLNNGVLIVPNIDSKLYNFNNESFTTICKNANNILLGTNTNAIVNFDPNTKLFQPILKLPNNHEVLNITFDNSNKIFVSSNQLNILEGTKVLSYQIAAKNVSPINTNLYAVAYASDIGIINAKSSIDIHEIPSWLTTKNGLIEKNIYKLNIQKGRCRDALYHASTQTLYVATANGLFYFSPIGNGEIKYQNQSIYASQLTCNNYTVFAGTFIQSVFAINNKKAEQIAITNNAIYKIHNYDNFLYLVSDDGLIEYNTLTKQKRVFTNADGIPKAEIKDILVFKQKLLIATSIGLVNFDLNTKKTNSISPNIFVNEILVNGEKVDWQNNKTLPTNKNNISIHFSALSFKSTDGIIVKYKINDEPWQIVASNSSTINLPSLSSGKYNISIKAINEDGVESTLPTYITFKIATPFYKELWFVSLVIVLACLIVYIYFKRQLQHQKLQASLLSQKIELEKELQQSMLASIKSQMNPHFLFNALNTIQSYIYTNEKENASEYLGKFSELTRMILDMSNKSSISIATEIKALQLYLNLEKQRFEEKLNYQFYCDKNINQETNYIPSMLIQPYIENAIKHGLLHSKKPWQLSINFNLADAGVSVTIDDNGIGRLRSDELNKQKSLKHQSFSTSANKKRLEILNQGFKNQISVEIIDKKDDYGNALGTKVILSIPFVHSS
ncbi:MAG: sensor histidine kinase [Chitinophagaceae bacterium]